MSFLELKNTAHPPNLQGHRMYLKKQKNTTAKIICKTFLSAATDLTTTDLITTDPTTMDSDPVTMNPTNMDSHQGQWIQIQCQLIH